MSQETEAIELEKAAKRLSGIPGIGPKVGMMLAEIRISDISDLVGRKPESLYENICSRRGVTLDCCVLYHFPAGGRPRTMVRKQQRRRWRKGR